MKVYKRLLVLLLICQLVPVSLYAKTLEEARQEQATLDEQRRQALADLQSKNMTLNEILLQLEEVFAQKQTLETEKSQIENEVSNINVEIANKQLEIEEHKELAGSSLVYFQRLSYNNTLVDDFFSPGGANSTKVEERQASDRLVSAGQEAITKALELQKQLEEKKEELELKKVELSAKISEIENQEAQLEVLRTKSASDAAASQHAYDSAAAEATANQALQQMMIAAGCTEGQVYGVDCGVVQSSTGFVRPVQSGIVTWEYQDIGYEEHTGMDIGRGSNTPTPIYASAPGKVIVAGFDKYGGYQVFIYHVYNGQPVITSYCHMQEGSISVQVGQEVDTSTRLGLMGETGNAFGIHLHFEVSYGAYGWSGGTFVNPRQFVNFPPKMVPFNQR